MGHLCQPQILNIFVCNVLYHQRSRLTNLLSLSEVPPSAAVPKGRSQRGSSKRDLLVCEPVFLVFIEEMVLRHQIVP